MLRASLCLCNVSKYSNLSCAKGGTKKSCYSITSGTSHTSTASLRHQLPSCQVASILYKVRQTSLVQEDKWLVSLSSWLGQRKVLSVGSTMSSTAHPSLPWLFCSTPFPSSFINYIPLTNHNCGQLRSPNVKHCTRDSVSWQHVLKS